jgi:ParB family chromosome partitioning protein
MVAAPLEKAAESVWLIPVDRIEVVDRLRPVDPVAAQALAGLIKVEGHWTPIEVCELPGGRYRLVTGGHRLAAIKINGDSTIKALKVTSDRADRRMREVSENLLRVGLSPIDRAAFVAEFYQLLRAKAGVAADASPQSVAVNARWQKALKGNAADTCATAAHVYGWADGVADQIGLSRRSIYNDLELHRGLRPDVVEQLRSLPIAANAGQLRALAKLSEADQRQAVTLIVSGTAKGATDAMGIIQQKPKPSPEKKAWDAFMGSWSRMSAAQRKNALRELAKQGLPKGFSLAIESEAAK